MDSRNRPVGNTHIQHCFFPHHVFDQIHSKGELQYLHQGQIILVGISTKLILHKSGDAHILNDIIKK